MERRYGIVISKIVTLGLLLLFVLNASASDPETEKTGGIRGKVLTSDARPAEAVMIVLAEPNITTTTQTDGSFVFRHIAPGKYHLLISVAGYSTTTREVTVEQGKTATVSFTLEASSKALQEVVVTGNHHKLSRSSTYDVAKIPLKNIENPQVYTTITKDLLQQQQVFSVDDAMQNATGVTKMWDATGRGGDGGGYYNMRGFVVQSQLRNGIAGNVTSRIDASNLERIEVIKGPSATLFGSTLTSYGGLINRVTKKPYDHFGGEVGFAAGSFGFNRFSADINTPLDKNRDVLMRVNAAYNYEGSFQDYGFSRNVAIAPSLSYRVNDRLSFHFDAEYMAGQNTGLSAFFFSYGQPIAKLGTNRADELNIDYKRAYATNDLYQTSRNTNLFGQMTYRLSSQWSMQTNVTTTSSYSNGPSPYFYLLTDAEVKNDPNAVGNGYISRNDQFTNNSHDNVLEIQHNFNGDFNIGSLRNRFVGGIDFFHHHSNQFFGGNTYDTIYAKGNIPTYRDFNRRNLDKVYDTKGLAFTFPSHYISNTYSAYVSDVLNITDNLLVQAGLRIDYFDNKGNYSDVSGKYENGYTQTALSPKFGIVYQPIKDKVSLFANYQNGFTNKPTTNPSGKPFKPEQANQMEGGVKVSLLQDMITGTISYYDIRVKDIIRPGNVPNVSIQDGTQYSKGVEVEVIAHPARGLDIVAGYAYNDSKYEKTEKNLEGLRPATAGSPTVANLWVSYRIQQGAVKGLGFGAGGNYASDNKVVNDKALGYFYLPAYTLLNGSIFYENDRFRFGFKLNNITNKAYWIGYSTVNPQKTRNFSGSIAFKF
ncbi:TonB-dependent receptor [Chitinophaga varians]|uniref:TonB-dependent receptor n=1 Tax=Chitinophaga varians TaxID=2202339 RepID=UPI00165F3BE7|nr:TonB-dependent receptor [Chitinophaga varians]MBC9911713.1 TonB-dependent receptor [Chitinophaga varians]